MSSGTARDPTRRSTKRTKRSLWLSSLCKASADKVPFFCSFMPLLYRYCKVFRADPSAPMKKGGSVHQDPICSMKVHPDSAAGKSEYKGKSYYFCSPGCKRKFDQNPEQYLNKSLDGAGTNSDSRAIESYTCPMHPEIVRSEPGSCPICG